jgi:adenylosuccinate synthase
MAATIIIGSQWGDEGKGKIIDSLSESSDFVVRFHGGNNAGHTVINKYGKFPLHLMPSGIFAPKAKACIANGTVIDLEVLVGEIAMLMKAGFKLKNRFFISPRCHLIMPYHKVLDTLYEEAKGNDKTGTTGRGIGPVYADKVSYHGIRIIDLFDKEQFSKKLEVQLRIKNKIIKALGGTPLDQKDVEETFFSLFKKIQPFVNEPFPMLHKALKSNKSILLEGAQAVFLDNDWGTYPFVTASTILPGGANAGAGLPPVTIKQTIGVVKAYTTRVGAGPFPTELEDETGEALRKSGHEFGTTTGRPRRCGWFDAEMIRFAAQISGFTGIAITKLDVLDEFDELRICTGYTVSGKSVHYYEGDATFLNKVEPVYKTLKGWKSSTRGVTKFEKLPPRAQQYVREIERLVGVPALYISTGPERNELIRR